MPTPLVATSRLEPAPAVGSDANSRMAWYAAVARWAPSKHNSQPWRFVVRDGHLEFWADPMRILASTDPHRREMLISVGSAVHVAGVAARAAGHEITVSLFPDGGGGPAARIDEVGAHVPTPDDLALLAAVSKRRTDRGPLDGDRLPANLPLLLQAAAGNCGSSLRLVSTPADRVTLAALVRRADRTLLKRGTARPELARWLREPTDRHHRDGVPTDHTRSAASSQNAEFVQRDFSTATSRPGQDRPGRDHPLVGVLCTPADTMRDWLDAGQALGAILLRATAAGANASYLNQPVEDVEIRAELRQQLGLDGVAQLVLRLGVGGDVAATPRRDPHDLIYMP